MRAQWVHENNEQFREGGAQITRLRVTEAEAGGMGRSQCPQGSAWLLRSLSSGLRETWGGLNRVGTGQFSVTVRSFSLGLCEG